MNCFSLLLTFILVFFQVKQCYCLKKESLGFDTILSNPLESHANSKAIDSKGYLDTETIAPVSLSNEAKSRRRRYVAFPEGSSFSVSHTYFHQKLQKNRINLLRFISIFRLLSVRLLDLLAIHNIFISVGLSIGA